MPAAFVQRVNNVANAATIAISPTAGNTLIIAMQTGAGGGAPIASLTDNLSNTYSVASASSSPGTAQWWYSFFYLKNIPAGITGLTASFVGGTPGNCVMSALEYSGLDLTAPFIGCTADNIQATPGIVTDAITSATLSLTTVPAILIGYSADEPNNGTPSSGTGFTSRGSAGAGILWEDQRFTSNTSPAATFSTASHGTDQHSTFALGFIEKASTGAALAGAATDTVTGSASLTTGLTPAFAPVVLDDPAHAGGSDQIGIGSAPNDGTGDPARTAFTKLKQWAIDLNLMTAQLFGTRSLQTPTTGFAITVARGVTQLVINPAGTLATGTVTLPVSPGDNQPFSLSTAQTVTALTLNTSDGSAVGAAATTIAANTTLRYRYITSLNKWFREQ